MIIQYHRPTTIEEALSLLARQEPPTVPMGGGTVLNRRDGVDRSYAVVDLQALGLNRIQQAGQTLQIGATVTLRDLSQAQAVPAALHDALRQETNYNLSQVATIAGTVVSAGSRSPLVTVLLALDARLTWLPGETEISLGEWLPLRGSQTYGRLISQVSFSTQVRTAYASVARTPVDQPLMCAAVAHWPSGRTRAVVGGFGPAPVVVSDGPENAGVAAAARDAFTGAYDEWASAEYRQEMAGILVTRCLNEVEAQ